jgi:Xaa-Pro aminopeptidase
MNSAGRLSRREAMGAFIAAAGVMQLGGAMASPQESRSLTGRSDRAVGVGPATREYRVRLMHDLMDREQLDALAFTSADYFKFASNFALDVSGFERPAICVIPRNGEPFVILNELSTNHWRFGREEQRLWVSDASFYSEHPRIRHRLPLTAKWNEMVAEKLEQVGLHRSHIGTDGSTLAGVAQLLPYLHVEVVEQQCRRLRWVKHEEEIGVMREAAALADWGQERYRENIRAGRLVTELDMCISGLMAQEAARRMPGAELQIYCWTLSGPVSASPHGAGSTMGNLAGAAIEKGHVLVNAVYPVIDGLFVENERTWFCGRPSKRQIQLFEAARLANQAGREAAVSGNPIWSIDAAAQEVFERMGVDDLICHRSGHGLGLGGHDYPVDMAFNVNPLLERMVFSVEPGVYEFGIGGFRIDDTVVVGRTPQILTTTARDLQSQTIA